jgi:hypothetical protein
MKRFEGEDALTRAKNDVLERMSGCNQENCTACSENNKSIDHLVTVAQAKVLQEVIKIALKEVGNDLIP